MRQRLTDKGVRSLKPRETAYAKPDPELVGHWVRVQPSGAKSFVAVTRGPTGKQVWTTIGTVGAMTIDQARDEAREILARVRTGLPAREPKAESFGAVVESWRQRHLVTNGVRSSAEINRLLDAHVLPAWRDRELVSIRRSDIATLLDKVEDGHGAHCADATLTVIRSVMHWFAARSDFAPPLTRGMRRRMPASIARARVLSDDELRAIWPRANGVFGGVVRMCLLTAQRRSKIAAMRWADIKDGAWTVPCGPREKGTGGELRLPPLALAIIEAQPRYASNEHVFAGRGGGHYRGWTAGKAALDKACGVSGWRLHDLRRTARSLMSRARVLGEHGERTLGHAIGGVAGVYDRHDYTDEKADALARLAALIEGIVHPQENMCRCEGADNDGSSARPAAVDSAVDEYQPVFKNQTAAMGYSQT